jgi:amino acid adenylation domain-containing protein/thioester reductase-like protein
MSKEEFSQSKKALFAKLVSGHSHLDKIPKRPSPTLAPLSFAQQRLWFLEQLTPGSSVYNMHDAVRIKGKIDPMLLQKVLSRIILRHEALRTTFILVDNEPMQKISSAQEIELTIQEVDCEEKAKEIAKKETIRPFDLEKGPLFKVHIIRISEKDQILLWTMHHIISDGWSLGLIIKEVMTLIEAFSRNLLDPLPELPIQYGDFAAWQKEWLKGSILEKQISYWQKELSGNFPPLKLPFDYPRPSLPTYQGKRKVVTYSSSLIEKLTQLALQEEATLFMILLAVWNVLIYRYSGMEVLFVGIPIANRNRSELSEVIGFFANTLVIRADLHPHLKFLDFLKQIKEKSYAAYEHQDLPFERIVEILQPERKINISPFFQVMFVLQNQPIPKVQQKGLSIEPIEIHNDSCKFDLLINIYETQIGIEYSTDLFKEKTIERILEHYRVLIEAIIEQPDQTVSEISFLSDNERSEILKDWNQTETLAIDYAKALPQYVEEQVKKTPSKIAITDEHISYSYEELNARANQLAQLLIDAKVKPDVIVAIYMKRSIEQVLCLLAILKAGGAFLPLDTEYPEERINFMIKDSQTKILLHNEILPDWIDSSSLTTINVSDQQSTLLDASDKTNSSITPFLFKEKFPNFKSRVNAENLAYVIYTSGTTGKPNGVMITHRGICNRLLWMQKEYQLKPNDKVLQKTSCSFDVSVWEFFWPLISGSELFIPSPEIHRDPIELARCIQKRRITVIHFVPSMLSIFISQIENCHSLRLVFCSGESLSYKLVKCFQQNCKAELHNLYGPTEASIDVTFWNCSQRTEKKEIPIGRPIANTQIYILDMKMRPVPIGTCGELYIGGDGVGRGYLHRKELTQKKFLPDPFFPGKKLYKSGDLARFWENGVIEFLGRVDHQIKIRGVRIELEEIEQALLEYSQIEKALVTVREVTPGDKRIVAYIVHNAIRSNGKDQIDDWKTVFENTYLNSKTTYPLMNTIGWDSSYTKKPIPIEEMEAWVDEKVEKISQLKPKKILEIGCGTGMLLFRLAKECALYVGTDIAKKGLDWISQTLPQTTIDPTKVRLFQCSALDFSHFEDECFDLVILNSVVQYFPSLEYFLDVLRKASSVLTENGSIYLGDLRNFALMDAFYTSVILQEADGKMTVEELQKKIQQKKERERELFIDPELFKQWEMPNISSEIFLQHGPYKNEMILFRYNAVLSFKKTVQRKSLKNLQKFANTPFDLKQLERSINQFLKKKIPEYSIPSHIFFLDFFPLSPNGKIARELLPLPTQTAQPKQLSSFSSQTPLEKLIFEIWSELLGVSQIESTESFFDLGGHSLLAAQVVLKLSNQLGIEVPLRLLFQFPTIAEFAKSIETNQENNKENHTWVQMLKDSSLSSSIVAKNKDFQVSKDAKKIFLTGATGFLGIFLLKDLLLYTQSTVYCLIRARDVKSGLVRLKSTLQYYHLIEKIDLDRIVIVPGHLNKKKFGLNKKIYTFLTQEMDSIYHCGANVHFALPYDELRNTNVLGMMEILHLATKGKAKPVHYISTIYTLTDKDRETADSLTELHDPHNGKEIQMGYLQSKWVAEQLALKARNQKIPISIYRIGRIGGDTQIGACQKSDFYWGLIRACIKLGKIPENGLDENLIPVDIVSRSVVGLATLQNYPYNATYHLINSETLSNSTLITSLRKKGYKLKICSFNEWKRSIFAQIQKEPDDPAATFAGFLSDRWNEQEPLFSSFLTQKKIEELGIPVPKCESSWIEKTIDFFIQNEFFPS